jgi:hypothetical protein
VLPAQLVGQRLTTVNTTACTRNDGQNRQLSRAAALPAANQMDTMLKVIPSSTRKPMAAMSQKMGSMGIDTPSLANGNETKGLFSFII